jgi:hypothetical protein
MAEEIDEFSQPATIRDVAFMLTNIAIELVAEFALTSKEADEALIEIGNKLLTASAIAPAPRARRLLRALSQQIIETEAGARI